MLTSGDHRQPRLDRLDLNTGRERTRTPCPAPFNGLSNAILRKMLPSSSTPSSSSQRVLRCAVLTIGQKLSRAGASSQEMSAILYGTSRSGEPDEPDEPERSAIIIITLIRGHTGGG